MQNLVRELREAARMTQFDFAQATGLSLASIQGWESGKRVGRTSAKRLEKFATERGFAAVALQLSRGEQDGKSSASVTEQLAISPVPGGRAEISQDLATLEELHQHIEHLQQIYHRELLRILSSRK